MMEMNQITPNTSKDLKNKLLFIGIGAIIYFVLSLVLSNNYSAVSIVFIVVEALLFGVFMFFAETFVVKKLIANITFPLQIDEEKQVEVPASIYKGLGSIGGKFIVTNRHLFFKSHSLNFSSAAFAIPIADVKQVVAKRYNKFTDNGLQITTTNGKVYDLIVYNRDEVVNSINQQSLPVV